MALLNLRTMSAVWFFTWNPSGIHNKNWHTLVPRWENQRWHPSCGSQGCPRLPQILDLLFLPSSQWGHMFPARKVLHGVLDIPPPPDAHFFFEEPHCTNGLGSFGEFENGKDIVLSHVVQLDLRQRPASIVCSREGSFPTCTFVYLFYSEKLHVHVSSHTLWGCFLESTDDNISWDDVNGLAVYIPKFLVCSWVRICNDRRRRWGIWMDRASGYISGDGFSFRERVDIHCFFS